MAASSLNAVRVKLYFDYPPPSMPDCRMSWVLVDLNKCRVVADLCSVIREKFDYSRKTGLDLFIENCFLPPTENIYVVRDNDSIRVKVSSVSCEHGGRKRFREDDCLSQIPTNKNKQELSETNGVTQPTGAKKKKHKAKKKRGEKQHMESGDASKTTVPTNKDPLSSKSQTDKNSKKAFAPSVLTNGKAIPSGTQNESSDSSDGEEVTQKPPPKAKQAQVASSKPPAARKTSSSDTSSSEDEKVPVKKSPKPTSSKTCNSSKTHKEQSPPKSITNSLTANKTQSEDEAPAVTRKAKVPAKSTNPALKKQPQTMTSSSSSEEEDSRKGSTSGKTSLSSKLSTPKKPPANAKKSKTPTSSDSSSSSEAETCKANLPATPKPSKLSQSQKQSCSDLHAVSENGGTTSTLSTPVGTRLRDTEDKAEASDSSSSDTELLIKRPNPQLLAGLTPWGRGRGIMDKAKGRGGIRVGFGRARGTPWKQNFHYNYDNEGQRNQKETQTNKSLVLQNPPEPSPKRDYSTLPLLAAPPAVGQKIVFKLLELTENYTPEVSDYKEGKIIRFDLSTKMVELELLTQSQSRTEPGKFDLVYQNPDGSERVEYAVTSGCQLIERWESLLEPRLIVQSTD